MRRSLLVLPILLTACADTPLGPSDTARTPPAPSFGVAWNYWSDVTSEFLSCGPTPEVVLAQGRVHQVAKQHLDYWEFWFNYSGFTGKGQTTGNTYEVQTLDRMVQVPFDDGSMSGSMDIRILMIAKGSTDNLIIVVHETFTYPPWVVTESTYTSDCKG